MSQSPFGFGADSHRIPRALQNVKTTCLNRLSALVLILTERRVGQQPVLAGDGLNRLSALVLILTWRKSERAEKWQSVSQSPFGFGADSHCMVFLAVLASLLRGAFGGRRFFDNVFDRCKYVIGL